MPLFTVQMAGIALVHATLEINAASDEEAQALALNNKEQANWEISTVYHSDQNIPATTEVVECEQYD